MKYLGIVGHKGSGKDTAYDALHSMYGKHVARLSFADELKKEICEQLRADLDLLNANKNLPPFRQLLQNYGVWRREQTDNYWITRANSVVFAPEVKLVVVTDCRFINEAEWIRSKGGILIRVVRPSLTNDDMHVSETEQNSIFVDMHIVNDQTKLRLEKQMVDIVKNYFKLL